METPKRLLMPSRWQCSPQCSIPSFQCRGRITQRVLCETRVLSVQALVRLQRHWLLPLFTCSQISGYCASWRWKLKLRFRMSKVSDSPPSFTRIHASWESSIQGWHTGYDKWRQKVHYTERREWSLITPLFESWNTAGLFKLLLSRYIPVKGLSVAGLPLIGPERAEHLGIRTWAGPASMIVEPSIQSIYPYVYMLHL